MAKAMVLLYDVSICLRCKNNNILLYHKKIFVKFKEIYIVVGLF